MKLTSQQDPQIAIACPQVAYVNEPFFCNITVVNVNDAVVHVNFSGESEGTYNTKSYSKNGFDAFLPGFIWLIANLGV